MSFVQRIRGDDCDELEFKFDKLKRETEKAWIVVMDGEEFILSKKYCELLSETQIVYVPDWLAEKAEMI